MRDADRGQRQDGLQMEGEPCTTWMVATGRVDQQGVGEQGQASHRRLAQRPFSEGEEPWLIGVSRLRTMLRSISGPPAAGLELIPTADFRLLASFFSRLRSEGERSTVWVWQAQSWLRS